MWSDETWKVAHRCGEKHISKSKWTKHLTSKTLLEVEMSKKCAPLWQSKCTKHLMFGPLLEVEMSKKCTLLWREAHFAVNMYKTHHARTTFGSWYIEKVHAVVARSTFPSQKCKKLRGTTEHFRTFRFVSRGRCKGLGTLSKVSKGLGFCSISRNDGRRGTFEEDLQRCISRGRRSTRDMFIRDVRRSGHWFLEKGCILEHQIFSFGKLILRDRCSTSYVWPHFFVVGAIL